MAAALKDKPDVKFRVPSQMKLVRVSRGSGMRVGPGEDAILEAFKPGTGPPDTFVNPSAASARSGGGGGGGRFVGHRRPLLTSFTRNVGRSRSAPPHNRGASLHPDRR